MTPARANLALLAAAAVLVAAALPWSAVVLAPRERRTQADADSALDRIAAREQSPPRHGYATFGPTPGERESALPGLDLGPAAADFAFDALPGPAGFGGGSLRLRAVSRPESVAAGRVVPLLRERMLAGDAEPGHEGRDAGPPGPAAATR